MADRSEDTSAQRVCVGAIAGAQGVRGALRIKSFTEDPAALADYAGLSDEQGRPVRLSVKEVRSDLLIVAIDGVNDRDAAQALKGTRLYVSREELPEVGEEEYYHADLIGLAVKQVDGADLGQVKAVHDFGAGDILEISGPDGLVLVPFTREAVPIVDIANRQVVVDPPPEVSESEPEDTK